MPRFHVRDAFATSDKSAFVLAGVVVEGEVAAGMHVRLPVNAKVMTTAEIDRLETVVRPDGEVVCVYIRCAQPGEASLWEALKIQDRTIDISAVI